MWKADLERQNPKAAEALADPDEYPNLFPDLEWALKVRGGRQGGWGMEIVRQAYEYLLKVRGGGL